MKSLAKYIIGCCAVAILLFLVPQNVCASNGSSSVAESDKAVEEENQNSDPIMIAHRGMSFMAPENTIPAIEMAGIYGYDGVEFDVYETKDGKFVVLHDPDIKRMTNGKGKVRNMTLAQIRKVSIDYGNGIENYKGLKIPTLEEVLSCCREYHLIPCIDVKNIKNTKSFLNIVNKYQYLNNAKISSKSESIIKKLRAENSKVSLHYTCSEDGIVAVSTAKRLKCNGVYLETKVISQDVANYAKENKLLLTAWTVENSTDKAICQKRGVDYIITNSMTDSNNFENLSVDKDYEIKGAPDEAYSQLNDFKSTDSIEKCLATQNTWFEENNVTTFNLGKDMNYHYEVLSDDLKKGNIITVTAKINSLSGNVPYFTVYHNNSLKSKVEDVHKTSGWHTIKLVYTASGTGHELVLFGLDKGETGVFQIKDIQVSKFSRYQPDKITLNQGKLELTVGSIYNLSENIQYPTKKTIMKWKSSKEKIATVSDTGCITAKKVGKSKITITAENGITSTCTVVVKPKTVADSASKNRKNK